MKSNSLLNDRVSRRYFLTGSSLLLSSLLLNQKSSLFAQQAPPATAGPADPKLIEDLIAANRILYMEGVNDGFGHVSVRHNRNPNRFLLARSLAPNLVTPDDLIEYDLDSNPVNLKGRAQYSERFIHGEIYKARPDVMSVGHNHSPDLVAFSVSNTPLRAVSHMAPFIGDGVPLFDIRKDFGMTDMLINNAAKGKALAQTLGNKNACLIRGHGVVVVGPGLLFTVGRSIYLTMNAKVQSTAMALGQNISYLDPQEAKAMMDAGENRGYERPWELWKLKAMGK